MRPTQMGDSDQVRGALLADVLDRYRAVWRDSGSEHAAGPDPISQWAAAEYGDGIALAVLVELLGPLAADAVAALALEAVTQLTRLHVAGGVHGDLNPWNITLSDSGVRLVHSGIAHTVDGATLTDLTGTPRSVAYLTPEQILGRPVGPVADIFALGAVLAFAAAGLPPFGNDEPTAVLYRIVHEEAALDAVPDTLRGLVKACMSKDPGLRPSLQTLADRARGVLSDAVAGQPRPEATVETEAEPTRVLAEAELDQPTAAFAPVPGPHFDAGPGAAFEGEYGEYGEYRDASGLGAAAAAEFESSFGYLFAPTTASAAGPGADPAATAVFEPAIAALGAAEPTLTEVPLRDPFEPVPTRRDPRYVPVSQLTADRAQPTLTALPLQTGGRARRARYRPGKSFLLGTVVLAGVAAAFLVRGATHRDLPPAPATPSALAAPAAPLPGTFLAGPGCPASRWAAVAQAVTAASGLVANVRGGAPACGGAALAFVKSGSTAPGGSSFTWAFQLGGTARCTLSVYVADAAPSSGLAQYRLLIPAARSDTPTTLTFQINQGKVKGQWVVPPQLANLALPQGSVQLILTDAGAFPGDRFHVTASAVEADCAQVP